MSDHCTVIEVFTIDREGCCIGWLERCTIRAGDSLRQDRTHLDQVVDVFYVTDRDERKVMDGDQLAAIRAALTAVIAPTLRRGGTAHTFFSAAQMCRPACAPTGNRFR